MTQLRKCKCDSSNILDTLEHGVGHRGSSFFDFDAVSHDGPTHRFLVREIKRPHEKLDHAVRIALMDLALEPRWTVWFLCFMADGRIAWLDMLYPDSMDVLTADEYRERLREWWDNSYHVSRYAEMATEIRQRTGAAR